MRCLHLANMFFVVSDSSSVKTVRFLHVVSCAQGTFLIIDPPFPSPEGICPVLHSGSLCKLGQLTAKAALMQARRALLQSREGQKDSFFLPSFPFFASKVGMMTEDAAMTKRKREGTLSGEKELLSSRSSLVAPHLQIVTKGFDGKRWWMLHWFWTPPSVGQFKFEML